MKFKYKKGRITQGFNENSNPLYKNNGLSGHSGIDWVRGYGSLVRTDNTGYVYKIYKEGDLKSNWVGVYLLVPDKDNFVEVCMGHFSKVFVHEGDTLLEGQYVGKEGNKGDVYSGGVRITPEMQRAGSKRGSHVHESYRPVKRVKRSTRGKKYLTGSNGRRYKDSEGYMYEILHINQVRGCVDPMKYKHVDSIGEKIKALGNAIKRVRSLI